MQAYLKEIRDSEIYITEQIMNDVLDKIKDQSILNYIDLKTMLLILFNNMFVVNNTTRQLYRHEIDEYVNMLIDKYCIVNMDIIIELFKCGIWIDVAKYGIDETKDIFDIGYAYNIYTDKLLYDPDIDTLMICCKYGSDAKIIYELIHTYGIQPNSMCVSASICNGNFNSDALLLIINTCMEIDNMCLENYIAYINDPVLSLIYARLNNKSFDLL
jgi:hypothetical protein